MAKGDGEESRTEALRIPGGPGGPALGLIRCDGGGKRSQPPLLFVHGYSAGAWIFAEHLMPGLADRGWTSYALDLRGHGESDGRESVLNAGLADYQDDLRRAVATVLAREGRLPVLIGHSLGAVLSQIYAAEHPIAGLVLLGFGDANRSTYGLVRWASREYVLGGILDLVRGRTLRLADPNEPEYSTMFPGQPPAEVEGYIRRLQAQPESRRVFVDLLRLQRLPRPKLRGRVLVLAGDLDPIAPHDACQRLAGDLGGDLVLIPGAAHDLTLGPAHLTTLDALVDWLGHRFRDDAG